MLALRSSGLRYSPCHLLRYKHHILPATHYRTLRRPSDFKGIHVVPAQQLDKQLQTLSTMVGQGDHHSLNGLLGTCILMFLGAYGCGMLPSWVPIPEQQMASISALGAGLLLGSALVIILPEGFEAALHAEEGSALPEWSVSLALLAGFWCMLLLDMTSHMLPSTSSNGSTHMQHHPSSDPGAAKSSHSEQAVDSQEEEHVVLMLNQHQRPGTPGQPQAAGEPSAAAIGAISEQSRTYAGASSSSSSRGDTHVLLPTVQGTAGPVGSKLAVGNNRVGVIRQWLQDPTQQALLGLLVHAASDGLAVGASALSSEPAVSLSVAAAMVVHKGPVAVGLAAYLRSAAWRPSSIHRGVLLFSATSPLVALVAYLLLSALPSVSHGTNIPLAVLFSGGTVLYAATMHILPSALGSHAHQHGGRGSGAGTGKSSRAHHHQQQQQQQTRKKVQLMLVSVGMLLPMALAAVFHHEH